MLKKHILLITCILMVGLLMSCQANNPAPTPSPTPQGTVTPAPSASPSPSVTPDVTAYEITGDTYAEGDITIQYPQITGLGDTAMEEQINVLIQADAIAIAEEGGSVDVAYTVTWAGPRLLSIRYSGLRSFEGSAYPNNLFYTTNIDIANGTKVRLADVITIDAAFIETFKAGEFVPQEPGFLDAEDMIRETVAGYDLTQTLADADNGYGAENPDYCFSYFTEGAIGISVGVPHAVGDHAEFEISYPAIQDKIKQNVIWDDFAAALAGAAVSLSDLYGDWVVSGHLISNPMGSAYSQEDIDNMIGKELTYAEDMASYDGETLSQPYYKMTTVTKEEYEADSSVTFDDLGIDQESVMDITVCTDAQLQNVWLIPAGFVFVKDTDHLIIRGDGEFFALTRK